MCASHGASPSDEANARRKDEMPRALRVALVAESFLPAINGVTNSVLRVANHLTRLGHICHIYAPSGGAPYVELANGNRLPVTRIKSLPFPGYSSVRVTFGKKDLDRALEAFSPDVIHLASPALLGRNALAYAERTKTPVVAIYQTDLVGFAEDYRIPFGPKIAKRLVRSIHNKATMTLAPSTDAINALRENEVENVHYWPRGVDSLAFSPAHRDGALRSALAPRGELIVGFIGRLAPEKRPLDLVPISKVDGVKLVVVGDGPEARNLKAHTRGAMFFGELRGSALARVMASLDVLVHTGWHETFCQTVQESLASAVPVIAPPAGGPRDLVSHDKTGWLIDTKCPQTLADLVTQLRDNRELVRQKRPVARESVSTRTWSKVGNALLEHYYQTLGEPVEAPIEQLATVTALHDLLAEVETRDSVKQAA